jgi:hypothetical protein
VSDEDGLAKPESALLESDPPGSEELVEESESLELEVSGPLQAVQDSLVRLLTA